MEDRDAEVRDWATTGIGGIVSLDGPEIRAALLRRATDTDEITRAEALHGLALRGDTRVVPYLIAELTAGRQLEHLFCDAAKSFLGIDEDDKVGSERLLARLRSVRSDVQGLDSTARTATRSQPRRGANRHLDLTTERPRVATRIVCLGTLSAGLPRVCFRRVADIHAVEQLCERPLLAVGLRGARLRVTRVPPARQPVPPPVRGLCTVTSR
jgi:hypothetical protein